VLFRVVHYIYIYIFISKEILLPGSWNLTSPPHQSPGGGSVSWGTGSDGILVRRAPSTSTSGVFRAASGYQTYLWVYANPRAQFYYIEVHLLDHYTHSIIFTCFDVYMAN
jgi:hypothetical protein